MTQYIDSILESKEKKVWEGKINRKVMFTTLIIGLIILGAISFFLFSKNKIDYTKTVNGQTTAGQTSGSFIGIIVLTAGLAILLLNFFSNLVKEYAITNKRVIIKSGLIGTDYKSIYFEQISQVIIDVGLIGKIFGTGNLKIDTGKTDTYSAGGRGAGGMNYSRIQTKTMYEILKDIDNPYEVYKMIQPSITGRRESLYSGRADRENNPEAYKNAFSSK